jgi:2-keto-4-pentenoate hydratase/2-oxohepta-3-ene-1,7-dioic acid hydratase in catechol pathway
LGIQIVRFAKADGLISFGRLESKMIHPIPGPADSLASFITHRAWQQASTREEFALEEVKLLSPVTAPCQVICQGKNYLDHLLETGVKPANKDFNILFSKADSTLAAPEGEVLRPEGVRLLDYELELGLVMKSVISGAKVITEQNLHEHVAGLVMANDLSARDVQVPQRQWFKGKSYRGFCPVGPILYLMDENDFSRLNDLELHLSVNGETRQKANTKQMMYRPADTLTEVSRIFDLRTGDLLLTGTPGGVAMKVKPKSSLEEAADAFRSDREKFASFVAEQAMSPRYLKDGDVIESTIRSADGVVNLGQQRLRVRG